MTAINLDDLDSIELPVEISPRPDTVHMSHWCPPVKVLYEVLKAMGSHALALSTPEQITGHFSRALIEVQRACDPSGSELENYILDSMSEMVLQNIKQLLNVGGSMPPVSYTESDAVLIANRMSRQLADQISYGVTHIVDYYPNEFDNQAEPLTHPHHHHHPL